MKAAIVDLDDGSLLSDRFKVKTPQPSTPEAMAGAVAELLEMAGYRGPVGFGFPAAVIDGMVTTANNIDKSWIGVDATEVFGPIVGAEITIVNDADAAAICESRYGAARDVGGVVLLITFGTGIGSGLLNDGVLVPNLQLGDLELDGYSPAEIHFSASAREAQGLTWEEWAPRVDRFLSHVAVLFTPRLIVVGGGVARNWDDWGRLLTVDVPVARAQHANNAGIIGAATQVA
jgi:polyphosphate glucokinase